MIFGIILCVLGLIMGAGIMRAYLGDRVLTPEQRDELLFEDVL